MNRLPRAANPPVFPNKKELHRIHHDAHVFSNDACLQFRYFYKLAAAHYVNEETLSKFKQLWKQEFDEDLSDDAALDEATAILTLFNAIYRPIKKEWLPEDDSKDAT